jgi:hypothetical protein
MGQMIFLGQGECCGLGGAVPLSEITRSIMIDLSEYPRWMVILGGTFVAVGVIWIMMKLLRLTLWLLLISVLIGGLWWAGWELMQ